MDFPIFIDYISSIFLSLVLFISGLIVIYSIDYMGKDLNLRFIFLIILFVFSIIILILSPNLVTILLGWDGLGLVSYCLVIYYNNFYSFGAGILTVLINRIGDVIILVSIRLISIMGCWNYLNLLRLKIDFLICLFIIVAAITKRAQIPFSSWLPAAIAAPTPVSALVHSSTLVTAGVYLLIRFNYFFLRFDGFRTFLLFIGILTTIISSVCAIFENDVKKIIALSTLRQLGLIISTFSLKLVNLCFFHLIIHALFKALLFMCAGNFIHMSGNQDIRNMGGILNSIPLTFVYFNTSNLALCGFPFLSGFFSKDIILEIIDINIRTNIICFSLFYFRIGLTLIYTIRLLNYSVKVSFNLNSRSILKENIYFIQFSMFFLFFCSIVLGSIGFSILISSYCVIILPLNLKLLAIYILILRALLSLLFLKRFKVLRLIFDFILFMWFMPVFSGHYMKKIPLNFGFRFHVLSLSWIEKFLLYKFRLKNLSDITKFSFLTEKSSFLRLIFSFLVLVVFFRNIFI